MDEQLLQLLQSLRNAVHTVSTSSLSSIVDYYPSNKEASIAPVLAEVAGTQDRQEKKKLVKRLKSLGLPIAIAGTGAAAAGLLHPLTATRMPVQVTRFMGEKSPYLIRGRVSPESPASTIDETGSAYISAAHPEVSRAHLYPTGLEDLMPGIQAKLAPGQKLGLLELVGHGTPAGQEIGAGTGEGIGTIERPTVQQVSEALKTLPWAPAKGSLPKIELGGCHTGLCYPSIVTGTGEKVKSWARQLSDITGTTVVGARGYRTSESPENLTGDVARSGSGYPPLQGETGRYPASENAAVSIHRPGQPDQVIYKGPVEPTIEPSKQTYWRGPQSRLSDILYNVGKPSAIAGALATPFISSEPAALSTAIISSLLASPMVATEAAARLGQSRANLQTMGGNKWSEILKNQAKVLPYLGLAALPLLTYSGAKFLGRWKPKTRGKKRDDEEVRS